MDDAKRSAATRWAPASAWWDCGGLAGAEAANDPLAPKAPHFPAKAKRVIYLFLNGGPSQVDTFDPKPMLTEYNGKPMPSGNLQTERKTGNLLKSPFTFKKYGQSGIEVSEIFPKLGECADDLCVIRSMYTDRPNHEPSLFMLNSGDKLPGRPSMGSWVTYGLGTENQNLPGFVVLCPGLPVVGHQLWSSTLPARGVSGHVHQYRREGLRQADPEHPQQESDARAAARRTGPAGETEPQPYRAAGQRSATGGLHPIRRDRLPHAGGSARRVRYHQGAGEDARALWR